ncbi:MAG: OsmC family protein [Gammaproteobacteria bacterium]|nr:OsmC family protein [Gammaproteobacteria bacterium]
MTQSNTQQQSPRTEAANVINGVDLEVLGGTVGAIQAEPELGASHFRVSNAWVDGARNESRVTGFYGAAQEIAHRQAFTMIADEPPILAGNDEGANPVEHLLHALASCLTTAMVAHAAVRGIRIGAMDSELEGDIDLNGFLGLNPKTPKGFTDIRAKFRVDAADGDIDAIRELAKFSPVFNTLTHGVNVDVQVKRK